MPTYGKQNFKESNINYLNKDFQTLKSSLMNYAKSYFPNSYKDFNETSPGMMLLEMNAYVGDVLSFYIDQQYKEMLLPLAEERRNIINMAKMFGYKVKPIVSSFVDLTFNQDLDANGTNPSQIDYTTGGVFDVGIQVQGDDTTVFFETLDVLDFQITGSNDTSIVSSTDTDGLALTYTLSRTVRAVSGQQKSVTFDIGAPEKFKKITLADTNVIDIISCKDSSGNDWYEVDFLAQDKVPISTHYTQENRESAYQNLITGETEPNAVPYSLQYIKTTKRFTRETNVDNTTSLIFGNGVLKNGQVVDGGFIDTEQIGITVPGQTNNLSDAINPLLGDEYSTLGETPNNTTLTITYRVGGGISSNAPSNSLTTVVNGTKLSGGGDITDLVVVNNLPAVGGKDEESVDEIREKAKAFFTTQNRCVTKEDYEARIMNIPPKYGNIAKVYVTRNVEGEDGNSNQVIFNQAISFVQTQLDGIINGGFTGEQGQIISDGLSQIQQQLIDVITDTTNTLQLNTNHMSKLGLVNNAIQSLHDNQITQLSQTELSSYNVSSINIYVLAYDINKNLLGNPMVSYDSSVTDNVPTILLQNIKNYLENFKILTDTITINNGYIVNFGVFFDVVAEKYADKQQVKVKCIEAIKNYFDIDKMQFNQPIYVSNLEYELMGIEGVRSIGHVTITQEKDYHPNGNDEILGRPTYGYVYSETAGPDINNDGVPDGGFISSGTEGGYGYKYEFKDAILGTDEKIIKPPLTSTPTVFELKYPNENIKGRVR